MIEEIRIADLGVIGAAHVALGPGLTVVTGETGAGKTMVLTALSLLLGGKADPATVRTGSAGASVEGRVVLEPGHPALERASDAGGSVDDDGSLLLVRTVSAGGDAGSGRSRAFVGGRSVPQGVLAELAEQLVTVHGQADQARLRAPAHQRAALDEFAGPEHARTLTDYRDAWSGRARLQAELDELVARAQERSREAELLRLGLAEVERVDPQPDEDVELAAEEQRLAHAEDLRVAAATAHTALAGRTTVRATRSRASSSWSRPGARSSTSRRTTPRSPSWAAASRRRATCSPTSPPSSRRTPTTCTPTPVGSRWSTSAAPSSAP